MLRYGFREVIGEETPRHLIAVDMDGKYLGEVIGQYRTFKDDLPTAVGFHTIRSSQYNGSGASMAFDFLASFSYAGKRQQALALRSATRALQSICNTYSFDRDKLLFVKLGNRHSQGGLTMTARFDWPKVEDRILQQLATARMQEAAADLQYTPNVSPKRLSKAVFAQVNRETGITLETSPATRSSISSDNTGLQYEPALPTVELRGERLQNVSQQIICLAGAIAIAHAEELL